MPKWTQEQKDAHSDLVTSRIASTRLVCIPLTEAQRYVAEHLIFGDSESKAVAGALGVSVGRVHEIKSRVREHFVDAIRGKTPSRQAVRVGSVRPGTVLYVTPEFQCFGQSFRAKVQRSDVDLTRRKVTLYCGNPTAPFPVEFGIECRLQVELPQLGVDPVDDLGF